MEVVGEQERSSPSPAASPEFEFWMVGKNPAPFQSPELLTADELFSDGIVLPLRTLQQAPESADGDGGGVEASALAEEVEVEAGQRLAESGPAPTPDLPAVTFKWKDIFKATGGGGESKDRKKMERRGRTGLTVTGIRLGRASPVWQLRRNKLQQQGAAAEQKQSTNDTGAATKKKPTTDAATTTQEVDGDDNATPTQSVSTATAPAPATTGCRNNASCSEAGGEEVNPPQGLGAASGPYSPRRCTDRLTMSFVRSLVHIFVHTIRA
uniref:Uncharacterized protein n=1 Tax=Oryza brachyantha TaxID=4533 RepID=J3L799_ORYBR